MYWATDFLTSLTGRCLWAYHRSIWRRISVPDTWVLYFWVRAAGAEAWQIVPARRGSAFYSTPLEMRKLFPVAAPLQILLLILWHLKDMCKVFISERYMCKVFISERYMCKVFISERYMCKVFTSERYMYKGFTPERYMYKGFTPENLVCQNKTRNMYSSPNITKNIWQNSGCFYCMTNVDVIQLL